MVTPLKLHPPKQAFGALHLNPTHSYGAYGAASCGKASLLVFGTSLFIFGLASAVSGATIGAIYGAVKKDDDLTAGSGAMKGLKWGGIATAALGIPWKGYQSYQVHKLCKIVTGGSSS